ncbi:hypothetical protein [Nocardioides panzhihuensis]|uniref:Bacteriorhodopsin n=1 Tax=Nocardioides panzhihuensis TaxID=860243 RepID=A0A7Z0DLC0_9ACTN|nr:hypothetical protein [Nocardioides panzhihuensis]NYI77588.1 bacteriorhodopsin [Nocardioides panzhihuensis]
MFTEGTAGHPTDRAERWVIAACALQAINTTIHHIRGALLFDTPGRYLSIVIVLCMLALPTLALAVSRRTSAGVQKAAWWTFWTASFIGFVIVFGLSEGLVTHVINPLVEQGYPADEPFDLLFQATGVLHVVPAVVAAALLTHLARARRSGLFGARA